MRGFIWYWGLLAVSLAPGCGESPAMTAPDLLTSDRPYEFKVPPGYDKSKPTPLVILMHGYTKTASSVDQWFGMSQAAMDQGFLLALPEGTRDEGRNPFWNATDGCCDLFGSKVDDVAYLKSVIKDIKGQYNVDPKRVFLAGHSNGGFMSYRMACDDAEEIAAIVSLSGGTWKDPTRCHPSGPVSMLEVHSDMDGIIHYDGGTFGSMPQQYTAAKETVAHGAALNGCTGPLTDAMAPMDIDTMVAGSETRVERYSGCPQGAVELWTIQGGGHLPSLPASWATTIYGFMMAHAKP